MGIGKAAAKKIIKKVRTECNRSPSGKHQWRTDNDHHRHGVFFCKWCGVLK